MVLLMFKTLAIGEIIAKGLNMRILDENYYKRIYADGNPLGTILRTPPPDFTELDKICEEFEKSVEEMHVREGYVPKKESK